MGNLFSIHKDILKILFRVHLDKYDRTMLLWSVGVKSDITIDFFGNASYKGYVELLEWTEKEKGSKITMSWINKTVWDQEYIYDIDGWSHPVPGVYPKDLAVKGGNISVLEWFYKHNPRNFQGTEFLHAVETQNMEVLQWLKDVKVEPFSMREITRSAIEHDWLELLQWLSENYSIRMSRYLSNPEDSFPLALLSIHLGRTEIFKWIEQEVSDIDYNELLRELTGFRRFISCFNDDASAILSTIKYVESKL